MDTPVTPTSASPSPPAGTGTAPHDTHTHTTSLSLDEIVRRDLETRTRAVVDVLYELASRAADVQPSEGLGDTVYVARAAHTGTTPCAASQTST